MNKITQKITSFNKNFRESKAFGYIMAATIVWFLGLEIYARSNSSNLDELQKWQEEFQNYKKEWEKLKLDRLAQYWFDKDKVKSVLPLDSAYYFQNKLYEYDLDWNDLVDNDKKVFMRANMEELKNITDYLERVEEAKK